VPPTPGSLLHTPLVTSIVKNITSFVELCRQGDCITEHDTSKQGAIKGTTPSNNENPGNPDDANQNDQQLLQPIQNQGVQPKPEPEPQPAADAGSAGQDSGGGACVPDTEDGSQSLDQLSQSGQQLDRAGYTKAGRALTKHASGQRGQGAFPSLSGRPDAINQTAQSIVDEILTNPSSTFNNGFRGRFGPTIEVNGPDGQGLVYNNQGNFLFFKEC
jgi:hypothetical protein